MWCMDRHDKINRIEWQRTWFVRHDVWETIILILILSLNLITILILFMNIFHVMAGYAIVKDMQLSQWTGSIPIVWIFETIMQNHFPSVVVLFIFILFHLIPSYSILFHLIPSYSILFHLILYLSFWIIEYISSIRFSYKWSIDSLK
jgi:hypothetical protein